jgi:hypothetical protein
VATGLVAKKVFSSEATSPGCTGVINELASPKLLDSPTLHNHV